MQAQYLTLTQQVMEEIRLAIQLELFCKGLLALLEQQAQEVQEGQEDQEVKRIKTLAV